MPDTTVNIVNLHWQLDGSQGDPLVLVHGSLGDRRDWDQVVPLLARSFCVLTYDRRGHGQSECIAGQGSIREDVADLASLIEHLNLAPAHILGNSFGASIALRLASRAAELFRSLQVHEPPLFGVVQEPVARAEVDEMLVTLALLVETMEAGEMEAGVRMFIEDILYTPGAWEYVPEEMRQVFIFNAPTFLDELQEPEWLALDLDGLANFAAPLLLTRGERSPAVLLHVVDRLEQAFPQAQRLTFMGADHGPQNSHPVEYAEAAEAFIRQAAVGS